jgi:hypothetical protein
VGREAHPREHEREPPPDREAVEKKGKGVVSVLRGAGLAALGIDWLAANVAVHDLMIEIS